MFNLRLLFVAAAWGVNFSLVKFALTDFHPLGFTVIRFALASFFLVIIIGANHESYFIDRQDRFTIFKLGLVGIALYNIFFMYGLKYTTAANSALLISLSPMFAALIQAFAGKERLTPRIGAGLALASLGVFLIIRSHYGDLSFSLSRITGDILTLCATITWALYTIIAKPLLEKYPSSKVTAYSMLSGSILLLPASIQPIYNQSWSSVSLLSWSALAFASFVAGGIAYVFWYQGVKELGVTRTMAYHYFMPFAAVLFAAVLGEKITLFQIVGGTAILVGVYLVQMNRVSDNS
jgi:drug/metabolite transporter (DMT)-like permease